MVMPNDNRRSVQELVDHARKIHLELVAWSDFPSERTFVLAAIEQNETQLQTVLFLKHEGEPK